MILKWLISDTKTKNVMLYYRRGLLGETGRDRQIGRQAEIETYRQTDRQTDRQIQGKIE